MGLKGQNASKKLVDIWSNDTSTLGNNLETASVMIWQTNGSRSLGSPEWVHKYNNMNSTDLQGGYKKNDHKEMLSSPELVVSSQPNYDQRAHGSKEDIITEELKRESNHIMPQESEEVYQVFASKTQASKIEMDNAGKNTNNKQLHNLQNLEKLLFKIFKGDHFSIEDFQLKIPELHILTEILIRKNKNASKNMYRYKNRPRDLS